MATTSYPIPKPLWDAIENVLLAKSKELMKDIAKNLNQSDKALLEAFKAKKHTFHLIDIDDTTEERFQCEAILFGKAVAHRCRKAVLLGQKFCPEHEFWLCPTLTNKPTLRRLVTEEGEVYFIDTRQNVYTIDFQHTGVMVENKVIFFEVEEEEEFV